MVSQQEQPDSAAPLSGEERAELARLRTESAAWRARGGARPPRPGRARRWGRTLGAVVLIVIGCAKAPQSVTSVWARSMVTDTERYVETVAPLATDPAVQNAVTADITNLVFQYVDVRGITTQALTRLGDRGLLPPDLATQLRALAGPVANGVESFTEDQVGKIVQSEAFARAWEQANRTAHEQLVAALTGEGGGAVTVSGGSVSVNLAPLIDLVKQRLVAEGFQLAQRIPATDASFVVYQSDDVTKVQDGFDLLNNLGRWLPLVCFILIGLGVFLARNHRLAFIGAGLGVALAMLAVAIALQVARRIYLDAVPTDVLPPDAAAVMYDSLVRFLREAVRAGILLGLVVAAGAFLSGPSATATWIRRTLAVGIRALRQGLYRIGVRLEGLTAWVASHAGILRGIAVAAAFLVLILVTYRTPALVAWLSVGVLAAVFVIQVLATPGSPRGRPAGTTRSG